MFTLRALFLSTSLLTAHASAGQVIVVDAFGAPGAHFTSMQLAVDSAMDGDTLLVRPSSYLGFTIDGKGLEIISDGPDVVQIGGTLTIQNLPADRNVLLHGISGETLTGGSGLVIRDCAGPVWVEDGQFDGPQTLAQLASPGIRVESSSAVSLVRVSMTGGRGISENGGAGLSAFNSEVTIYDTAARGGVGEHNSPGLTFAAGQGVLVDGGLVRVSGGSMTGGLGATGGGIFGCDNGGDGGPGLLLLNGAVAELFDVDLAGGGAGGASLPCVSGNTGPASESASGTLVANTGTARNFSVQGPLRAGQALSLNAAGLPGDMVFVLSAFTHSPTALNPATFLPNALLPLHGGALIFSIGTTDASGELQLNLLAPPPVPGGLSTTLFTQAFFVNAGLTLPIVLGAPQALTLLDATL